MTTRTRTIPRSLILDAIDSGNVDYEAIRDSYSGRGMYGGECFGIVMRPGAERELFAALGYIQGQRELEDDDHNVDLLDLVRDAHTDNMGYDVIVYFPRWTLTND